MQFQLLQTSAGRRSFVVVLATGDEVMQSLRTFVEDQKIDTAQITGIGAFSRLTLMYFDWDTKSYETIPISEQVEVASLNGDVALGPSGEPALHIHLVIGKRNGNAMAGHLSEGRVRPTLELIVEEPPAHLRKIKDPETGLALIQLEGKS
jgi:predicted DNA-binding protein with PD1-like motif